MTKQKEIEEQAIKDFEAYRKNKPAKVPECNACGNQNGITDQCPKCLSFNIGESNPEW